MTRADTLLVLPTLSIFLFTFLRNFPTIHALKSESIISGEYAEPGTYTYHVAINRTVGNVCGGALIGPSFVLTAAHCIYDKDGFVEAPLQVQGGSIDLADYTSVRLVKTIYVLKEFMFAQLEADIAVLKLSRPFHVDNPLHNISVARLPYGIPEYDRMTGVFTGFGFESIKIIHWPDKLKDYHRNGLLKFALVDILPSRDCERAYGTAWCIKIFKKGQVADKDRYLCGKIRMDPKFNYLKRGPCIGDSGGPLVVNNNILIGIVIEVGKHCDERDKPARYTRVYHYLDFIQDAINDRNTDNMTRYTFQFEGGEDH